jgi:hypothetical protein
MAGNGSNSSEDRLASDERLERKEEQLHDPDHATPRKSAEQSTPEPERLTTPQEVADQDIARLENPPQAEGPRERNNDAV